MALVTTGCLIWHKNGAVGREVGSEPEPEDVALIELLALFSLCRAW